MKKLFLFLALVSALQAVTKVTVMQVEYVRSSAYAPDPSTVPGITVVDTTPSAVQSLNPGYSSHATEVIKRIVGGNATGLVGTVMVAEAVGFLYPAAHGGNPYGMNAGRTLDPTTPAWDVENHSWGGTDPLYEDDTTLSGGTTWDSTYWGNGYNINPGILHREVARIEKFNIIACIALPDPGDPATRELCAAHSRNILRVGAVAGEVTTSEYTYDVINQDAQADYTSYDCPDVLQTVIAMISYLKTNNITYNAGDVCDIVRSVALAHSYVHNHAGCMTALYAAYPTVSFVLRPGRERFGVEHLILP